MIRHSQAALLAVALGASTSGLGSPDHGGARLVLGIAIVLVSSLPMWALLLWMATSSVLWRWKAEKSWKTLLAPVAAGAVVIGGIYAWTSVSSLFISRSHRAEREVVAWVGISQLFFAVIAVLLVAWAREQAGVGTVASARSKLRRSRALVLAWGALAALLAALKAGRLGGMSTPSGDWCALAGSSGAVVTLVILLIIAIVNLRKDATGSGPIATRSGGQEERGVRSGSD